MLKIGHRGVAGYEPENTLLSIQKALDLEVDAVEFDVHVCKSGEVVLIHDSKVDRTTTGRGLVAKKSLQELKKLDAGKGQKIPTLEEALDLIKRKTKVNIELKGKNTANPVYEILKRHIDRQGWNWHDFIISSSSIQELQAFTRLTMQTEKGLIANKELIGLCGLIFKTPFGYIRKAKNIQANSIHLSKYFCSKKSISMAKKEGFKVYAWTVNEPKDIRKIKTYGVDGIISDYPDRL